MTLTLIFLIIALVLFVISAANFPVPRVNLVALGLAAWVAAEIAGGFTR